MQKLQNHTALIFLIVKTLLPLVVFYILTNKSGNTAALSLRENKLYRVVLQPLRNLLFAAVCKKPVFITHPRACCLYLYFSPVVKCTEQQL
jgi:hypothetical protein